MKRMYLMMVAMLSAGVSLQAQDASKEKVEKKQMTQQEERLDRQARQLAQRLMLDDKTTVQFEKVYKDYQAELQGLTQKTQKKKAETDEEIEASMMDGWNRTKKTAEIQEKYFKEFKKFLTVKQAQSVLEARGRFAMGGRFQGMPQGDQFQGKRGQGMPGQGMSRQNPMFNRMAPGMGQRGKRGNVPSGREEKDTSSAPL